MMKALILAAGLGTRLLPYTSHTPKPLFPIAGRPIIDWIIDTLIHAGCSEIMVNTHHLHDQIACHIASSHYPIPIHTRFEPILLGTGGAIRNCYDFWDSDPFFVINSDIVTSINLKTVYEFHRSHHHPATLVLCHHPAFNSVSVDADGWVTGFHATAGRRYTFTGIQVLDPDVLSLIPEGVFSSSIDAYQKMISEGKSIKGFIAQDDWTDIGTPERYRQAAITPLIRKVFEKNCPNFTPKTVSCCQLKGDGSDRAWHRLTSGGFSVIMVDHGIRKQPQTCEVDSFIHIGTHLHRIGVPVPKIIASDAFSGLVLVEDLGDVHLQTHVQRCHPEQVIACYQSVIDILIRMSVFGAQGFERSWTYQTDSYHAEMILEKECRYFVEAFVNRYAGIPARFEDVENEFRMIADRAVEFGINGFMHRDLQSRNIMVNNGEFYVIDFQGGRIGPIQYDLASLLIDPYTHLPEDVQSQLIDCCLQRLTAFMDVQPERFLTGYRYCCLTRNLQILGAFGYLTRVKKKTEFETYIPTALKTLKHHIDHTAEFPMLSRMIAQL